LGVLPSPESRRVSFELAPLAAKALEKPVFPFPAAQLGCRLIHMANQPRQRSRSSVRYTWRPEVVVSWAVVRLNEDGSETHLGAEPYKEAATRWAAMLDKAAQEDLNKRPKKGGDAAKALAQVEPPAVEFAKALERPNQQITFPWSLFSRRPA
jgi:hypothetical protein